eukprot:2540744-Amphidinium_carterae.1
MAKPIMLSTLAQGEKAYFVQLARMVLSSVTTKVSTSIVENSPHQNGCPMFIDHDAQLAVYDVSLNFSWLTPSQTVTRRVQPATLEPLALSIPFVIVTA